MTLHTLGLMVLVGASAALDLRLLGFGSRIPVAALRPLLPTIWAGFLINAATGSLLFVASPTTKATAMFAAKLGFVAVGIVTVVLLGRRIYGEGVGEDSVPFVVTSPGRRLAAVSLTAWVAAIAAGRLLAYV